MIARVEGFPGLPDLDVARGDVILLRGPNGCGKTSLLRLLAGLDAPMRAASVRAPRASLSPQEARDACVGLTVAGEARLRGLVLPDAWDHLAGRDVARMSSGEQRRLAHALAGDAPLLLLDEPTEGLDAEGRARLRERVSRHRGAVVLADHGDALADLATRVVAFERPPRAPLPVIPSGPGRLEALAGPNGCGKSTRLLALARRGDGRIALPHARDALHAESVEKELARCDEPTRRALVPDALLPRHPLSLSGGEAKRVQLAKTLGVRAECYLLDEPEAHLDDDGRAALANVISRRVAAGARVLMATHDEAFLRLAHRVEVMA